MRGLVPGSWWGVEDDGRTSRQMAHSSTGRIASSLRVKGKKGGGDERLETEMTSNSTATD